MVVETSFNVFDLIVLGVVGLSALFSFFRGFVREFFSLGAWVGASIITLYALPTVSEWLTPHVKNGNPLIVNGLAGIGTFMLLLIVISIFTGMLMKLMKTGADIGLLDNFLGLCFGILRGVLLVAIGYIGASVIMPKDGFEANVEHAVSAPYVKKAATFLQKIAPGYLEDLAPLNKEGDKKEDYKPETPDELKPNTDSENKGYQWESMDKLQKMIDEKAQDASDKYRN